MIYSPFREQNAYGRVVASVFRQATCQIIQPGRSFIDRYACTERFITITFQRIPHPQ
jgi:hypothetical protein